MKAHELLSSPEKWTKGVGARDAAGQPATADETAASWCMLGAIHCCYPDSSRERADLFSRLKERLGSIHLSAWNDAAVRTYDDVVGLLRELDI